MKQCTPRIPRFFPPFLINPTMHFAQQVRLTNIYRGRKIKMSAQAITRSLKTVDCPARLCCVLSSWYPMLYFTNFRAASFILKSPLGVRSLAGHQIWRFGGFHERSNFEGRMLAQLCQLFTDDSLDRPFIQGRRRRLRPGGTSAITWILVTLLRPIIADDSISLHNFIRVRRSGRKEFGRNSDSFYLDLTWISSKRQRVHKPSQSCSFQWENIFSL